MPSVGAEVDLEIRQVVREDALLLYGSASSAKSVESRATFAEAFTHRRCVIPTSSFYEWDGPDYARQPYWVHRRDGDLLLFAGM
jgi:hypothetical protein